METLALSGGGWEAALLPGAGAALARLRLRGRDVLAPLPEGADPNATWAGAFLMLPWANRLDEGRLPWAGGEHRYPLDRPAERTAIHGLARQRPWRVEAAAPGRAVLSLTVDDPGLPHRFEARLTVELGEAFRLALSATHRGEAGVPYGHGWHPFLVRPEGTRLALRAAHALRRDGRNLPVEAAPSAGLDGGEEAFGGLDTHFAGWDGRATLDLGEGLRLSLEGEGAWARNLHVFAPLGAPVLCLEPVSHAPDAANRPWLAPHGPMRALAPGETLEGAAVLRAVG